MNFWIKVSSFIFINSLIGAYLTKLIQAKAIPWYCTMITGSIAGLIWGYMSTSSKPLIYLSVLYDVLTAITYILVFILLGDKVTTTQFIGIVMSLIGIFLISE
jgi:drug/metabolite transporter (DMT)-like permease